MFILRKDRPNNSLEEWDLKWYQYQQYLKSISLHLPESAQAYALADWHYNHLDHRAPHDAWLQRLEISESVSNDVRHAQNGRIVATLLGAYHDGIIEIEYVDVLSYAIQRNTGLLGDWQYDEVRISDDGSVLHEVEFDEGSWLVVCRNLAYRWSPHN